MSFPGGSFPYFTVGELADEVGRHDEVAEVEGEALEGGKGFGGEEGSVGVCVEAGDGLLRQLPSFEKLMGLDQHFRLKHLQTA
ncbi:hypothetical protein PN498_04395 [Oscillatoria sp. CS-180]|uniref:hypothetical protein n=1 Tax=Oscillatoria sp. CS-180 TaxID=3021720 RepID=UPI00232E5CC9|nr:hypothetical protein [Oscillatoria sp. CS-180]MDB9525216.1 hypothetical protein [Oscillatoria sp. CS-180]